MDDARPTNPALDCPRCGKNYGGGKRLFQHLRRAHGLSTEEASALRPRTVWRCAMCGQEFRGNGMLTRHIQSSHGVTPLSLA